MATLRVGLVLSTLETDSLDLTKCHNLLLVSVFIFSTICTG